MLERQGSVLYRDQRTIAHSTALESITMEIDPDEMGDLNESGDEIDGQEGVQVIKNVWGGIPAKSHKGENLLLFIGKCSCICHHLIDLIAIK